MSRDTKSASIPSVPSGLDRSLANFLQAVKESIEVGRGRAGDDDTYVTRKYLESSGYLTKVETDKLYSYEKSSGSSDNDFSLGIGSVHTQHIADRAVTKKKLALGAVLTVEDVLTLINQNTNMLIVSVVDIDDPTELGYYAAHDGSYLLAYEAIATSNRQTLYVFDSANSSGANSPYVVAGSTGYWVAVAGSYCMGSKGVLVDDLFTIGFKDGVGGFIKIKDASPDVISINDATLEVYNDATHTRLELESTESYAARMDFQDDKGTQWVMVKLAMADPDLHISRYTDGALQGSPLIFYRDGTVQFDDGNVGVGGSPLAVAPLTIYSGALCMQETNTPLATASFGKLYTKSDNILYFQDGAGDEHAVTVDFDVNDYIIEGDGITITDEGDGTATISTDYDINDYLYTGPGLAISNLGGGSSSISGTGSDTDFTVVTALRINGSDAEYKTRDISLTDGFIHTVGAESAWTVIV